MPVARERFQGETDCLLCCLNYCLGLSNVVSFPYLIYNNGGVVFIVVYLVLLCVVAVPMLYLEIFLGQFCGWSVPRVYAGFPMAKGLGWTMILIIALIMVFYVSPVAYCVIYLTAMFQAELPWNSCGGGDHGADERDCYHVKPGTYACSKVNETLARRYGSHNYSGESAIMVSGGVVQEPVSVPVREYEALRNNCVSGTVSAAEAFYTRRVARSDFQSDGFTDSSTLSIMAMTVAWALVFVVICMGLRSIKKFSTLMLAVRLTLLAALCVASSSLSGAGHGVLVLLRPDFSKAYSEKTWVSASQHMFHSIGLSVGTLSFFGSYNRFDWPILRTAVRIITADFLFSLFAACTVFSIYGHLTDAFPVEIIDLASWGTNYAFVTFPECAEFLPWSRLWMSAFYVLIAVGTLGSASLSFATAAYSLADLHPALFEHRTFWLAISCAACFVICMPLSLLGIVSNFRSPVSHAVYTDIVPWIGFAETITVAYAYGLGRFADDVYFTFNERPPVFLQFCWRCVCPTTLMLMSLVSLVARASLLRTAPPGSEWANPVIMFVFGSVIVIVGAFVLHALAENKYDLYAAMEPEPGYGPKDPDQKARYVAFLAERNALPAGRHPLSSSSKASLARPSMALEHANEEYFGAQYTEVIESAPTVNDKSPDVIANFQRANAASDALVLPTTSTVPTTATGDTSRATTAATNTALEPTTATTLNDGKDTSNTPDHVDKESK